MVKREVLSQKLARADAWLGKAESRFALPKERFVTDEAARDLAMFHLFLAIQECIDMALHWISDEGLAPADDYASAFDSLSASGCIGADLSEAMKGATGLRNRIAHGYGSVDAARVYEEAKVGMPAIRRFLDAVAVRAGL